MIVFSYFILKQLFVSFFSDLGFSSKALLGTCNMSVAPSFFYLDVVLVCFFSISANFGQLSLPMQFVLSLLHEADFCSPAPVAYIHKLNVFLYLALS